MPLTRQRPLAILAVFAMATTIAIAPLASPIADAATKPTVQRLSGADRYAESVAISRAAYPATASTVVIASGTSLVSALSAAPVAAKLGGPVLLTSPTALSSAVVKEITRLKPSRIVIAGSTSTISGAVAARLATLAPNVVRASGSDRYAVSAALVRIGFPVPPTSEPTPTPTPTPEVTPTPETSPSGEPEPVDPGPADPNPVDPAPADPAPADRVTPDTGTLADLGTSASLSMTTSRTTTASDAAPRAPHVYIATGRTSSAAIVGSALAARNGAPLLVVDGKAGAASAATLALLRELGTTKVTLVGSTTDVSTGIARSLAAAHVTVARLSATTSVALSGVVAKGFPAGGSSIVVLPPTLGTTAVPAAALAAARKVPLMLSGPVCADATLRAAVSTRAPKTITLVGAASQLRGLVGQLTACSSTTDPKSTWVLVNKKHVLHPKTYIPSGLRRVAGTSYLLRPAAATALEKLFAGAKKAGAGTIRVTSAYRSYPTQASLHATYLRTKGKTWTLSHSARAGFSEHQTGFAADVMACTSRGCGSIYAFAGTKQQKWVAKNAWKYGFIVRYEAAYTKITGYSSEPWHLRYVGTALAADYHAGGFHTLEQYLGYAAAPNY